MKLVLLLLTVFSISACNEINSNKLSTESSASKGTQIGQNSSDYEIVFTKPYLTDSKDTTIRDKYVELINSASKGSTLRVSFYSIKHEEVVDAFSAAHKKGVHVQIIYDGGMSNKSYHQTLLNEFGGTVCTPQVKTSCILFCNAFDNNPGCLSNENGAINHNKFTIISELENGKKNIVIQTSHNMTTSQLKKFNDMAIFNDGPSLYQDYSNYWEDQARMQASSEYAKVTKANNITIYRFPFIKRDPVIDIFNTIDCSQPGGSMHASVAFFRRTAVADKIKQMRDEGCDIKVVSDSLLSKSSPQTIIGKDVYKKTNGIHSKFMTLSGVDKATGKIVKKVLTGSHNFTGAGLDENDETMLEINDSELYKIYEEAFQEFYKSI